MDLYAFAHWLRSRGVPESHVVVYRRAAEGILRDAGSGPLAAPRVEEIIAAMARAGASPRAVANLQRTGTALLQFQGEAAAQPRGPLASPVEEIRPAAADGHSWEDLARGAPPPPTAPPDDDDPDLPVAKWATSVTSSGGGPPPIAGPPPPALAAAGDAATSLVIADLPAAIEEVESDKVTVTPADPAGLELDRRAPADAPRPDAPAAPPTDPTPARRPTRELVRCPQCGTTQPRRPEGTCASCQAPLPHAAASDAPGRTPPAAARRAGGRRWLPVTLVLLAAAGVGLGAGRHRLAGLVDRIRSRPVPATGSYRVPHLDLQVPLGPGWRHFASRDHEWPVDGLRLRVATLERRGSPGRPDLELHLAVFPVAGSFAHARSLPDAELARFLGQSVQRLAQRLAAHDGAWLGLGCEARRPGLPRVGRCRGATSRDGRSWRVASYLVLGRERAALAVFSTPDDSPAVEGETEAIADSLTP